MYKNETTTPYSFKCNYNSISKDCDCDLTITGITETWFLKYVLFPIRWTVRNWPILPKRITKINIDAEVALPHVCTVHSNLQVTSVAPACCKSTDGKDLWDKQTGSGKKCYISLNIFSRQRAVGGILNWTQKTTMSVCLQQKAERCSFEGVGKTLACTKNRMEWLWKTYFIRMLESNITILLGDILLFIHYACLPLQFITAATFICHILQSY